MIRDSIDSWENRAEYWMLFSKRTYLYTYQGYQLPVGIMSRIIITNYI